MRSAFFASVAVLTASFAPALALDVPLVVDARAAQNWDEAH